MHFFVNSSFGKLLWFDLSLAESIWFDRNSLNQSVLIWAWLNQSDQVCFDLSLAESIWKELPLVSGQDPPAPSFLRWGLSWPSIWLGGTDHASLLMFCRYFSPRTFLLLFGYTYLACSRCIQGELRLSFTFIISLWLSPHLSWRSRVEPFVTKHCRVISFSVLENKYTLLLYALHIPACNEHQENWIPRRSTYGLENCDFFLYIFGITEQNDRGRLWVG